MTNQVFSIARYTLDLFQDSLITGVPQIILTQNIYRKILKSIVLLCCLIGFVYQTTVFLKIFYKYPTVLDINVEYPEIIEPPAITFCNNNGIKRTKFCRDYPNYCESPRDPQKFCKLFPEVCELNKSGNLMFPNKEAWHYEDNKMDGNLQKFGHLWNETLKYCNRKKESYGFETCSAENIIHMLMFTGTSGYRNCYTIYSNVGSSKLDQHSIDVPKNKEPLFHIIFDLQPDEYFRPDRETSAAVAIHSPSSLINPFFNGFMVKPGNLYMVHLEMVEEKLLPFPYETQCKDYKAMWRMRGGTGPLNQEMCIAECIYNASMEQCNCVVNDLMYYHKDRLCNDDELDTCFNFNSSECYQVCQQPCEFTDFEYDVRERKLEINSVESIEDLSEPDFTSKTIAAVLIYLKRPEIIVFSHRPQYEDIEVFSFLGGYVGMWLGISLIAVFDFLENLSLVFFCWIRRKMKCP